MELASLHNPAIAIPERDEPPLTIAYQCTNTAFIRGWELSPGVLPSLPILMPANKHWRHDNRLFSVYWTEKYEIDSDFFSTYTMPDCIGNCDKAAVARKRLRPIILMFSDVLCQAPSRHLLSAISPPPKTLFKCLDCGNCSRKISLSESLRSAKPLSTFLFGTYRPCALARNALPTFAAVSDNMCPAAGTFEVLVCHTSQ